VSQAIWAKGYTELLDLLSKEQQRGANPAHVDCYGAGEDLEEVSYLSGSVLPKFERMKLWQSLCALHVVICKISNGMLLQQMGSAHFSKGTSCRFAMFV
jgi:hypothetical protein